MKKLFPLLMLGLFVFTACENDEEEKNVDLTSEESKAIVSNTVGDMESDILSLTESKGVDAASELINLLDGTEVINGRTSQKDWTKSRLSILKQYFVNGPAGRVSEDEPTSFDDIKGLYEWNPEIEDFDKEESDIFIVKFPTEGSDTNNAELQISELEFETITDTEDGFTDEYEEVSKIEGYLKVDGETFIELSLSVDWSSEGFPITADIDLFVSPFSIVVGFNDSFGVETALVTSIRLDGDVIVGVDLDVTFESEAKEEPVLFEGNVQYRSLKIDGSVDVRDIEDDADPNDYIKLALYSDNSKVGDIVFVYEDDVEDYVAYVQYEDGTQEELEVILDPVLQELERIEDEFFIEDEDDPSVID
ncbi:hypothetical protein [Ekhidna sp.]